MSQIRERRLGRLSRVILTVLLAIASSCTSKPPFSFDFEREKDLDELGWRCRTLFTLSEEHATSGGRSLKVEFYPDRSGGEENYPGLSLAGFDPDWSERRNLVFDVYNPAAAPVHLGLRIDDADNPPYADRFNERRIIDAGENHVVIPLGAMVTSGTKRALRTGRIQSVILFLANPQERHTLYFDRITLE